MEMNISQNSQTRLKDNDEVEMVYVENNGPPGFDECDIDEENAIDFHHSSDDTPVEEDRNSENSVNFLADVQQVVEQSCCVRVLRSIWRTRLTEDSADRDRYVKTTLRELVLYLGFVIILCIMTYSMTSSTMYYFTKNTKDLFTDDDLANHQPMSKFWAYTEGTLLDGLYWEMHYNGEKVSKDRLGYIYFENRILGTPRLRQLRVRNDTCTLHESFKKQKVCYSNYAEGNEERTPYGLKKLPAWYYNTSDELGGPHIRGEYQTYGGGGYVQLLGRNKAETKQIIAHLKNKRWLDRGTRVVFIEFTIYNANINLFCIVTLIFEFPETGGMHTYSNFNTLRLLRYVSTWDFVVFALEIVFALYLLYYSIEEIMEISINKCEYFKNGWNVFDILIIAMGYVTIVFSAYVHFETKSIIEKLVLKGDDPHYPNFGTLASHRRQGNELMAVFILLAWIKIFKYLNFNKTMMHLQSTLSKCAKDVIVFAIMFLIIFIAFASWGNITFGTSLKTYSSMPNSMITLFRLVLGDFDFNEMRDARNIVGPVFFVLYVFFIFFVLINMFLAIINDTYAEVKEDIEEQETEFALGDYLSKSYNKMMDRISTKKKKIVDIQTALLDADTNQDNNIDHDELRTKLKGMGFADFEIECVFAKYDKDGDHMLNAFEIKAMYDDFEGQKEKIEKEEDDVSKEISEEENHLPSQSRKRRFRSVPFKKFSVLNRRVDRLEHSTGSILSKVEMVLNKMREMDTGITQRRETMTRIFDGINELGPGSNENTGMNIIQGMEKLIRSELDKWDKWDAEIKPDDDEYQQRVNVAY